MIEQAAGKLLLFVVLPATAFLFFGHVIETEILELRNWVAMIRLRG